MDTGNLPTPVKVLMAVLAGTSLLGVVAMFNPAVLEIVAMGLLALGMLLTAYHFGLQWYHARKSAQMSGQIQQHTSSSAGVSDPKKLAELDALKRKFDAGLEAFRAAGKDIYKLPWYLFVGEPGSGKTEAIRHSNVGFPPGLQDELQGVGGTVNMDWFFTNRAVMLDTAGRLLFTETSEWREFLKLLKRNRPNCPINGLFLVIPADSLIRDAGDVIAKKAARIAEQLELIQRTLDIRFPVFVLITKTDLLTGFRGFFDDITDAQAQHQILGWSNPEPRDSVFRPEEVDRHLQVVIDRVRKRRFGLLGDTIPKTETRRADEVDALYSLPHSFELIIPRLKSYLQTIFIAGEWSAKPLFLRGIYFTSALRDGVSLDQELACAMGVQVDALPGRAWDRERTFFLRDLFVEKAFRERGLVTRATNTTALIKRRRVLLFGCVAAAAAIFLGFTLYSYSQFKTTVGDQARYWAPAAHEEEWGTLAGAKDGRGPGVWHPIVARPAAAAVPYNYNGDAPILGPESSGIKLATYLARLREICSQPMKVGLVYRPLARYEHFEKDREKAQRVVFEASVVKPLVGALRQRMYETEDTSDSIENTEPASVRFSRLADAVAALIRIEADAINVSPDVSTVGDGVISPALRFVTFNDKSAADAKTDALADTLQWTYTANPNGVWPPKWAAAGSDSLAGNKAIQAGLLRLIKYAQDGTQAEQQRFGEIKSLSSGFSAFRKKEGELNARALSGESVESLGACLDELTAIKTGLDNKLRDSVADGLLKDPVSLSDAYKEVVTESLAKSGTAFVTIQQAIAGNLTNKDHHLFSQIQDALQQEHTRMDALTQQALKPEEQKDLQDFDRALLADFGDGSGRRIYAVRWGLYQEFREKMSKQDETRNLIGEHWLTLDAIKLDIERAQQMLIGIKAKLNDSSPDGFAAAKTFLARASEIRTDRVLAAYTRQAAEKFDSLVHFPLVSGDNRRLGNREIESALALIQKLERDINSDSLKTLQSSRRTKLEDFAQSLEQIKAHSGDISNARVTVSLVNYNETPNRAGLDRFHFVLVNGTNRPTGSAQNIDLGDYDLYSPISITMVEESLRQFHGQIANTLDLINGHAGARDIVVPVPVDGSLIYIKLTFQGSAPDFAALPKKSDILTGLR